jgi:hypothetical protein
MKRNNVLQVAANRLYNEVEPKFWRRGLTGVCHSKASDQRSTLSQVAAHAGRRLHQFARA